MHKITLIKMLMMMLGMICFTSCDPDYIDNQEVCEVSFKFNRCRCLWYNLNEMRATSEAVNYPIDYCNGFTGIRSTHLASEVIPKVKDNIRYCNDLSE